MRLVNQIMNYKDHFSDFVKQFAELYIQSVGPYMINQSIALSSLSSGCTVGFRH